MTSEELQKIEKLYENEIAFRRGKNVDVPYNYEIMMCGGTGCTSCDSIAILNKLNNELKKHNLQDKVRTGLVGCLGLCAEGPIMLVYPNSTYFTKFKEEDVEEFVKLHFIDNLGKPVENENTQAKEFLEKQHFIARKNNNLINLQNMFNDYVALGGFKALEKVLKTMTCEQVIEEVKKSGLRGRGGAGFPTGKKWELTRAVNGNKKYVICNADEGDPGAFMDRSIIEGNPFALIEAMAICAYSIGSDEGFVYIRAEYPLAGQRLKECINVCYNQGLLGKNIFGTNFNFDLSIKFGAGAFVCGEETALIHSIEGGRGEPTLKPPYPAESGLYGKPTNINNVETLVNIPHIILEGADWYSSIGTQDSKGTKVFALTGKVNRTGLIELPMGTTIREIVYDIGGGIPDNKSFKAVQMGGPSGGCIPKEHLDTPIDYKSLNDLGSMMGSGGMIVVDEDTCMVNFAKFFLEFTCEESCGKCTPCRIGTTQIREILQKICDGKGTIEDLDKLESLCDYVKSNSLCGLGQTAPNPVLSTIRYFKDEYLEHINEHKCRAKVCKNLISYKITDKCVGCSACSRVCPVGAITGELKVRYNINSEKCIKCGACFKTCRFGAIVKE